MKLEYPIVAEVREIRDHIAAEHHYDLRAIGRYYQEKQQLGKQPVINRSSSKDRPDTVNAQRL